MYNIQNKKIYYITKKIYYITKKVYYITKKNILYY